MLNLKILIKLYKNYGQVSILTCPYFSYNNETGKEYVKNDLSASSPLFS